MSFDSEFIQKWNLFLHNDGSLSENLYNLLDLVLQNFTSYISTKPCDISSLSESSDHSLIDYEWPQQIFYYLNEELAKLNRQFFKPPQENRTKPDDDDLQLASFRKTLKIVKCCLIFTKNVKYLDLFINTSVPTQILSSAVFLLKNFHTNEAEIKEYFKCLCFILIRVHDFDLNWIKTFYNTKPQASEINTVVDKNDYQRQFYYKFDPIFFSFFFESLRIFGTKCELEDRELHALLIHSYASILVPSTQTSNAHTSNINGNMTSNGTANSNQNDNLVRAITPQIVDYLFKLFYEDSDSTGDTKYKEIGSDLPQLGLLFDDKKLIVCRCLPMLVNILHISLPDKRQVDLAIVLEKYLLALEVVKRADIKMELTKSYLSMINDCGDKAALKIVLASKRFFLCLLAQCREMKKAVCDGERLSSEFLHRFLVLNLKLIKILLDGSETVKDTFVECSCYDHLYTILKDTDVIDKELAAIISEMITDVATTKDSLDNCDMAILLIKLLPFMQQPAQEYFLNNICRLCILNNRNQLKSCKNMLLMNFCQLLEFHDKFTLNLIDKIFKVIEILGRCSMNHQELALLVGMLKPAKRFPYGIQILRCFILWSKHTSSVGSNLGFLSSVYGENDTVSDDSASHKSKGHRLLTINQSVLMNMLRTTGTGALSDNAQQQAKHFFDFQHLNSGIRVPAIKKWPGYSFTFHCWIKLRNDVESFSKKRRQLYSFYNDYGQGFEAFFTPDCSSLVVSVCTKKEFLSVQLRELDFDASQSINTSTNSADQFTMNSTENSNNNTNLNNTTNTSDYWHSIAIVHVPAKNPFSYSQICIYIDGVLKKETDLKIPNFSDAFNHIRVAASCARPVGQSTFSNVSSTLTAPLTNLKNVFNLNYKGNVTEKSLNVTSIPSGSQDTVWDPSTCLMGSMSSCFALHDTITDIQARLLYELGPNQFSLNWLDIQEMSDFKAKFLFHYDAKCAKDLICYDLSPNRLNGKYSGLNLSCDNFKESLNSIGSVQIFYPLLNYLSSNPDYCDLVTNEWSANAKVGSLNESNASFASINKSRKSHFDDTNLENNIVALILNLFRYLFHNNDILQDRIQRDNGICLLSFLLQRLSKRFIDISLLRICQEFVTEASLTSDKHLLNLIYEHLIFDFRIWNKAEYEIRIGHIQYISTIIKDDKKYFRKKYGIQFFLDVIKTYFGSTTGSVTNVAKSECSYNANNRTVNDCPLNEQDMRNLRNSFFGLIKYYAQKEIGINELNAMVSFLVNGNISFQLDMLELLIALVDAPNASDQLVLLLFEPNMADGLYALLVQPDVDMQVQHRLVRLIKVLLKTKKVYEKSKGRMRLDECGGYGGLVSKLFAEYSHLYNNQSQNRGKFNEQLTLDLVENFLLEGGSLSTYDGLWNIISLLTQSANPFLTSESHVIIKTRLTLCEKILNYLYVYPSAAKQLVRSLAWQDIICQLFCVQKPDKHRVGEANDKQQPEIIVSSASYLDNEDTHLENGSPIPKVHFEYNHMMNSTMLKKSDRGRSLNNSRQHRSSVSKNLLEADEINGEVSLNDTNITVDGPDMSIPINDSCEIEADLSKNGHSHKAAEAGADEFTRTCEMLFEKLVGLIFKLIWEGVSESNEEAWKERCQIFSSLQRLSKEFDLIKPMREIELHVLELCVQRISSELTRAVTVKDVSTANENAREIIKLIDHFLSENKTMSEHLISSTITLLDQLRTFEPDGSGFTSTTQGTGTPSSVNLNTFAIINDELAETGFLGINILVNCMSSPNIEICAQAAAKINTIIHDRSVNSSEEACYLISSVEKIMHGCLLEAATDESHYAFLIPIMKSLIEKYYKLLRMNIQVPNIPLNNATETFYEDFKEYCRCDEWRIFIGKHVSPMREQYLAMTLNPCQMNMKIWWNTCNELLMVSVHKRNRVLGESKIKFEDSVYNSWREREKQEVARYQNFLIHMKRNNLTIRKQLHNSLRFFLSERGAWNEGSKDHYWLLSNHKNREGVPCKLVENLQHDNRYYLEASRLRDYSNYSVYLSADISKLTESTDTTAAAVVSDTENTEKESNNLAERLQINKQAINSQLNEDLISDEEFGTIETQAKSLPATATANKATVDVMSKSQTSQASTASGSMTSSSQANMGNKAATVLTPQEHIDSFMQLEEQEKLVIKSECELITATRVIKGRFELTNKYIYFFDTFSSFYYELANNDSNDNSTHMYQSNGVGGSFSHAMQAADALGYSCHDFEILNDFKLELAQLQELQLRRYNLRRSALEFFMIDKSNFFINFNKNIRNKIYSKIVSMKLPNMSLKQLSVRTPADLLKVSDYTQKWCNHEMSNFEYLMQLNTIAGRSFNDLSQYPIFPWILTDYTSNTLDLNDPNVYRDLSKPVGVLNPKYEDYVRQKYDLFEDPTGTMRKFHYGTHYSNSANVMHYLIRLEPFTTLHIQLQSDRFDVADRQFHNIANTWKVIYENPNDVKELIPEFFYFPEFLVNMNNFDFGELQVSRNKVDNVTLPKWAKSPEHFIYMHRKALESDYVSEHLHEWIDLIFGFKQQGPEAEKALNVFMYCTYEGAIDLDAITDPTERNATEGMISNFGQTPTQLIKEAHVKRKSREQSLRDKIQQGKPIIIWHQINNLKAYYVELSDPKNPKEALDPVIYISIPRNHVKSFMQQGLSDPLLSISQSGVIGVNGWQAYERSLTNLFSFEKDPSLLSEKTKKSIAGPFDPNHEIDNRLFILTHDSKLLITAGHWDNSLRVFSLTKYRNICQIYQHSDIVTCLAIDYTGSLLVSGSKDTTVMVWEIVHEYGSSINLNPWPLHILYGHTDTVTSVDISIELDMVVSASLDGTVNIHTIRKGHYVKTLTFADTIATCLFNNITVKLSNQRHILIYTSGVLKHQEKSASESQKSVRNLYLCSINGNLISSEKMSHPIQDMIIKDDYCILAVVVRAQNNKTTASGNFNTASKIIFKEIFELKTIQTMRLQAPISCMFLTREDSHLLVGLKDGKLIVITGERQGK